MYDDTRWISHITELIPICFPLPDYKICEFNNILNNLSPFAIPTEHAQNIDDVRLFGDKHEASVHFQWSEICCFHKNILDLNFADCLGFTPS